MKKQNDTILIILCFTFAVFFSGVFVGRATSDSPTWLKASTSFEQASITNNTSDLFINGKMNINVASVEDLLLVPEIGEKTAQSIVAYREENGPYHSLSDLRNVEGLNGDRLLQLADYITVGGTYENTGS